MIGTIRQKPCPTFNLIRKVASLAAGMTAVAAVVAAGACAANWTRRPSRQSEVGIEQRQLAALAQMADAVNAGDAGRYASVYAPHAVITIYGSGKLQGRDAIEQHEVELLREFPGTRLAFYTLWQREALAVVRYGVNGKTARGEPMGHEGLLFFRFDPSGLIVEEHRYLDSLTPMAQLGILGGTAARALPVLPARMEVLVAEYSPREKKNAAVVTAALAAMDSENEPAFLSTLADDPVVDELIYTEPFTGKQEVARWFHDWTHAVAGASSEITNIVPVGDSVLAETIVQGTLNGALGRIRAGGKAFTVHRAMVFELRNGRITHIRAYMNGKELAEAVGQWPPRA